MSTWRAFESVVRTRRSVRRYTSEPIAEQDMRDILAAGVLAPNSSNLQPFELYWVRSARAKKRLVKACLSQSAARKAAELVVCVARWDQWDETRREYLAFLETQPKVPKQVLLYYRQISRAAYGQGPWGLGAAVKAASTAAAGALTPVPRGPSGREDMRVWAVKSAALVCENMMLAATAKGLDSCPMEGMDPVRVGRLAGLKRTGWKRHWDIPMVLAFGHRDPDKGVWGTQWRRNPSKLIKEL